MALWGRKSRKRKSPPAVENTSNTNPQKQRKSFPAEVKVLAAKALEAGVTEKLRKGYGGPVTP